VIPVLWLLAVSFVVVLADGWLTRKNAKSDAGSYQAMVALYGTLRRLQVARFKVELRRDTARLWREVDEELREQDKRERGQ
jgi:hypothetical protein